MMGAIIAAVLLGPLDAARGGQFPRIKSSLAMVAYAIVVAWILVGDSPLLPWVAAAFMVGEGMGWGCPLGSALRGQPMDATSCQNGLERWQIGPLADNAWLALAARGALWGMPVALVGIGFHEPHLFIVPAVMAAAMVGAPALVRASIGWRPADHLWAMMEFVRGWIVGLLLVLATWGAK